MSEQAAAAEPIRALIADDEYLAREAVRLALASESDIHVVGEARNGAETVALIRALEPDVVFLDIQMPQGGGFDVVEQIGVDEMPLTIFVTAYDDQALRAFDVHAMDYVVKPIDRERFALAVARAREQLNMLNSADRQPQLAAVIGDLRSDADTSHARRYLSRLAVRVDERTFFVRTADVDWFGGNGNYVMVHVRDQQFKMRVSLRDLMQQLDPGRFRRVHRSTILNIDRVREVQPWFGGDYVVILQDGRQLRVSRTFAPDLLRPLQ